MEAKQKKIILNLLIILGPVLLIMGAVSGEYIDLATLGQWDIAISIGAMVTILIYLFRDKKG